MAIVSSRLIPGHEDSAADKALRREDAAESDFAIYKNEQLANVANFTR